MKPTGSEISKNSNLDDLLTALELVARAGRIFNLSGDAPKFRADAMDFFAELARLGFSSPEAQARFDSSLAIFQGFERVAPPLVEVAK